MGEIKRERETNELSRIERVSDCVRKREKARGGDRETQREGKREG